MCQRLIIFIIQARTIAQGTMIILEFVMLLSHENSHKNYKKLHVFAFISIKILNRNITLTYEISNLLFEIVVIWNSLYHHLYDRLLPITFSCYLNLFILSNIHQIRTMMMLFLMQKCIIENLVVNEPTTSYIHIFSYTPHYHHNMSLNLHRYLFCCVGWTLFFFLYDTIM